MERSGLRNIGRLGDCWRRLEARDGGCSLNERFFLEWDQSLHCRCSNIALGGFGKRLRISLVGLH
jgi:hypothetical protein